MKNVDDTTMIKLAFESLDLVILRSLLDQAMTRKPRYDQPLMNLLTRARDLLAECNTTVVWETMTG
jgi:hypothetical protein